MDDPDPVAWLVDDLRARGLPSLAWMVRFGEGGEDPLRVAWSRSDDGDSMLMLLEILGLHYNAMRARDRINLLSRYRGRAVETSGWYRASIVRAQTLAPMEFARIEAWRASRGR